MPASDATYRFELAKQGRALCQNTACKNAGVKIQKGEFRMGTLVDFQGNPSWRWKHWGCVTPLQIKNLQDQVGPLEDLDLDDDLPRLIDGYEDIDDESQEKIKFALQNGHVPDEDWKGVPELNRPGMKGINKRTPKKKAVEDDEGVGVENGETPTKPKEKKGRGKKAKVGSDDEGDVAAPKKKATGRRKVKAEDDDDVEEPAPPKRSRKRKVSVKNEEEEEEATEERPKKKSTAKKIKAEAEDEDEITAPPAKKSRARKLKVEEQEDEQMPDAPPAPVKREKVRKGKNTAVKAEVDEEEDVKPSIPRGDNQAPAPKRSAKPARGKKSKAEPVPDVAEDDNTKAGEEGQGGDKISSPAPDSDSAAVSNIDAMAGPALGNADPLSGVEADETEEDTKPAKAGRAKRTRKPAKGRAN